MTRASLQSLFAVQRVPGWNPLFQCLGTVLVILAGPRAGRLPIVNWALATTLPRAIGRREAAGAQYVEPLKTLCPAGECPNRVGSTWLYDDDAHLSATGSRRAARAFLIPALQHR